MPVNRSYNILKSLDKICSTSTNNIKKDNILGYRVN